MSLGPDETICAGELREAMRARLDALTPPAGKNVDSDDVRPNFDALGRAVHRILTVDAETVSAADQDATFWRFLTELRDEVEQLRTFDAGLKTAFAAWDPALPASGATLKAAIAGLAVPTTTPAAPASLKGELR
ncbi:MULTISPECIES: hypothetical protein [unclassified Streptomyces]|uniref:hypothetical protein n=1 Tax=unclassified Streptomyces TaxID=2593676 RepID=UPI00278C844F|nr:MULTISPECIES: hypothetical protein [unclassified Streptomyces]